jgi:hypothetical protein
MVPNPDPTDKSVDHSNFPGSAPWTAHCTRSKSRLPAAFRLSLPQVLNSRLLYLAAITEKPSWETALESGTNFSLHDSFFSLTWRLARPAQTAPSQSPLEFPAISGRQPGSAKAPRTPGLAGSGTCSFAPDLQGKSLVRRNHSEYPAADNHPGIAHDDRMVLDPSPC